MDIAAIILAVCENPVFVSESTVNSSSGIGDVSRKIEIGRISSGGSQFDGCAENDTLVVRIFVAGWLACAVVNTVYDKPVVANDADVEEPVPSSGSSVKVALLLVRGDAVGEAGCESDVELWVWFYC